MSKNENEFETEFERIGKSDRESIVSEFIYFLRNNKKWWLIPILLLLGLMSTLIVMTSGGAAPFIYTLF